MDARSDIYSLGVVAYRLLTGETPFKGSPQEVIELHKTAAAPELLNVFITPVTAIMASLLYFKTRKAGGESLRDASDQFEALDIPRSKWQARMKSRWSSAHTPTREEIVTPKRLKHQTKGDGR